MSYNYTNNPAYVNAYCGYSHDDKYTRLSSTATATYPGWPKVGDFIRWNSIWYIVREITTDYLLERRLKPGEFIRVPFGYECSFYTRRIGPRDPNNPEDDPSLEVY